MGTNLLARDGVIIADNVLFKGMVSINMDVIGGLYFNLATNTLTLTLTSCTP